MSEGSQPTSGSDRPPIPIEAVYENATEKERKQALEACAWALQAGTGGDGGDNDAR